MITKSLKQCIVEHATTKTNPFQLIQKAQALTNQSDILSQSITQQLSSVAAQQGVDVEVVSESVLHLLANILSTADQHKPIQITHINSVAAFLAGVEAIAKALPTSQDEKKKQNTLRVLSVAGMDNNGQINDATFPIVNLGAQKEELKAKYLKLLQQYSNSLAHLDTNVDAANALIGVVRQLRTTIDAAMRTIIAPKKIGT